MNISARQMMIRKVANEVLTYDQNNLQFDGHATIFNEFILKFGSGRQSSGGVDRDYRPEVNIAIQGRHFNGVEVMHAARLRGATHQRVWTEQYNHALKNEWLYVEYSNIHDDPEIGKFVSDDSYHHLLAVVCHEIAHAIHWYSWARGLRLTKDKPHGIEWQNIYRTLRRNILNPLLGLNLDLPLAAEKGETEMSRKAGKKGAIKKKRSTKKSVTKTTKVTKSKSGADQKVWDICNKFAAKYDAGTMTRKEIIDECVKAGLNIGTAGTQFSAWSKAR